MADGNVYPPSYLAEWLREYNSGQKWVQELSGVSTAQVVDISSWVPSYKNAATAAIERAMRPYFQRRDAITTEIMAPYRDVVRAALPSISVKSDVIDSIVQGLTTAIAAGDLPRGLVAEVHKNYAGLYPNLTPSTGEWPSWAEEMLWKLLMVFSTVMMYQVLFGIITEYQALEWLKAIATYVPPPVPFKPVLNTWRSRPNSSQSNIEINGEDQ